MPKPTAPAVPRAARRVIEEVGSWVGFGLANLACVLDPHCFVLGGGVVTLCVGAGLFLAARSVEQHRAQAPAAGQGNGLQEKRGA